MTAVLSQPTSIEPAGSIGRSSALADRLEQGARALALYAGRLTEAEWLTRVPGDGRTVGVIVHHVASVYPIEIQLAQMVAEGKPVVGVTMTVIHEMNARHASEFATVTKETALELLDRNSTAQAAPVSLYVDAPLTCQFVLEDHAVRHSYHHLARLREALAGRGN